MLLARFSTPGLAQVAYIVADPRRGVAAVIDPRRDIDDYLAWTLDRDIAIVAILETHVHADFVSGARELAAATAAPIYAGRLGESAFPHQPIDDGDPISLGRLRLEALWTPGHTPEHISYLLFDQVEGVSPVALFSGDALFAGEIGRPDLLGEDKTGELVGQLYETVHQRLAKLPDNVVVYPGHGAGSPCGKKIGDAAQTTIGQEKRFNYAFQTTTREQFVRAVMDGMPKPPSYYPVLKRINKAGPVLLGDLPAGKAFSPDELVELQHDGALLIDARTAAEFAVVHIPGSVNVGLGGSFAIWAGWLAPYDRLVALILPSDESFADAKTELHRIGVDAIAGYLVGGLPAWSTTGRTIETLTEMSIDELATRIEATDNPLRVLDVRDPVEWNAARIPGSHNVPAGNIARCQLPDFLLQEDDQIAVICGTGYRSSLAASLLQGRGKRGVCVVPGGMTAWLEAGLPTD